jgi:hypothetical protein
MDVVEGEGDIGGRERVNGGFVSRFEGCGSESLRIYRVEGGGW